MQNSDRIFDYFESKYGLGHFGLFKCISVASMFIKNKDIIPLSILCIAPSGQFKSRTTIELFNIFTNKSIIDLGSDFTIHSLIDKFDKGKKCNNRTLCINDLTLLFSSKAPRAKDRLVNALAETLSEGKYQYGERNTPDLKFEAKINLIVNITKNSYTQNRKNFLDNTFVERLVPFFYNLSDEKQLAFAREIVLRKSLVFENKIKMKKLSIVNYEKYNEDLIAISKQYKTLALSPSLPRSMEKVKAIVGGLCVIDNTIEITKEIIQKTADFIPFIAEKTSKDAEIIGMHNEGKSMDEIKISLNYDSNYPYKVIQRYRERGILS